MKKKIALRAFLILSATPYITKKPAASPPPDSSAEIETGYILREHEEKIGVFCYGSSSPLRIVEVNINTLSDSAKAALLNGVYAADEDEVNRRIEDYSS